MGGQLYNLTTTELQAEARRRGVRDVERLTRAQLVSAIRGEHEAGKGFLGRVFGFAKRAWEGSAETRPEYRVADTSADVGAAADTGPRADAGTTAATGAVTGTNRTSPAAARRPTPAGVFSDAAPSVSPLHSEPFPTQTMARILAQQGHYKRALAIYKHLATSSPDNQALLEELELVQQHARFPDETAQPVRADS